MFSVLGLVKLGFLLSFMPSIVASFPQSVGIGFFSAVTSYICSEDRVRGDEVQMEEGVRRRAAAQFEAVTDWTSAQYCNTFLNYLTFSSLSHSLFTHLSV